MAKHILLGSSTEAGRPRRALGEVAARMSDYLARRPWIERCVVHVATDLREAESTMAIANDGPDVVVELWTRKEPMDWEAEIAAAPLHATAGYEVDETVEKGAGGPPPGPMGGINLIAFIWPASGVAMSDIRARYARHAALALRVHVGLDSYSRNWVERISPPSATPYFGVSVLWFATDEDFLERHYDSPAGRAAIAYDVSGFLDLSKILGLVTRSQVLR